MTKTFAVVAALGLASAVCVCACDEDKKSEGTTPIATAAAPASVAAPVVPKETPAELQAKTMKALVEAWNGHDAAKVGALYEGSAKLVLPGLPDFVGRDAIVAEAKQTMISYPDFKLAITKSYGHGSTVALQWVITGKNDGPMMGGQKASGRSMGVMGASVITFDDDGLMKADHRYVDLPTISSQLDAKAKAGTFRAVATLPTGATEEHESNGTPDEAKALDVAKAFYTAFEGKKAPDLTALLAEKVTGDDYTSPATVTGPKAMTDAAGGYWKSFPDLAQTKPVQFAAGDVVVTEGVLTGTQKGALGPIKATNKPVSLRFVDFAQVKDGKVASFATYADSAELLIEIGAMPPMGPPPAGAASGVASAAPAAPAKPK
ncbi:MAG: ester cyclase [Polyangiaceae bacterium]